MRDENVRPVVSFTRTPPGQAVPLHTHPYHEVFVLIEGNALYRRAGEEIAAGRGTVIVIPPETPHGSANTGADPLVQLGIHERGSVQQTWLEE